MYVCSLCGIARDEMESSCSKLDLPPVEREPDAIPKELEARFIEPRVFAIAHTGTLYRVRDGERNRDGLLKIVRPSLVARGAERERLKRELVKQAALSQPHLLLPLDAGGAGSTLWLFREFFDAQSLRLRFAIGDRFTTPDALAISAQLAAALDELHRAGLLHRDFHPGHVLVEKGSARVRVFDAGIAASLEQKGAVEVRGTPGFVAPEQLKGRLVSFRSDLYALGCVMYELFAGRPPYVADSAEALLAAHAEGPIPPPPADLPSDVGELIVALLAKDPRERPFSAQQVRRILDRYLPEADGSASAPEERLHKETLVGLPIDELAKVITPSSSRDADRRPVEAKGRAAEPTDELAIPDLVEEVPPARTASVPPPPPSIPPPGASASSRGSKPSMPPPPPAGSRSVPPPPPTKGASIPAMRSSAPGLPSLGLPALPSAPPLPTSLPPVPATADAPRAMVPAAPTLDPVAAPLAETSREARPGNEPEDAPRLAEPTMELDELLDGNPEPIAPPPLLDLPVASSPGALPAPAEPARQTSPVLAAPVREKAASSTSGGATWIANVGFIFSIPSRIKRRPIASAAAAVFLFVGVSMASPRAAEVESPAEELAAGIEAAPPVVAAAPAPERASRPAVAVAEAEPVPLEAPAPVPDREIEEDVAPPTVAKEAEDDASGNLVAASASSSRPSARRAAPAPTPSPVSKPSAASPAADSTSPFDRYREEARVHFQARRYAKAAAAYEKAIAIDASQPGVHAGLGASRLALKEYRPAIAAYTRATQLSPRHSGFQAALGRAHEQAGERAKAISAYRRALELDPANGAAKQGLKRLGERS